MGKRKTAGRKRMNCKEVDYDDDEDEVQVIQEISAVEELHSLPTFSRHPTTESNQVKETEATMQSHIIREKEQEIGNQPLVKDCGLNGEANLNLMDFVQKLNTNVPVAEEVDSATGSALVTVAGYSVKGEVAPLLKEIFSEHGDIASECILQTSEYRASLLESVCKIYQELEPVFPNITSVEVDNMQARIKDLETIRLNVKCLYKRLEEISTLKRLFDKSRSLIESKARQMESMEKKEKYLEALEAELLALQQKISCEKAELVILKTETERIEAEFETMVKMETLPVQSMVPVCMTSDQVNLCGPMLHREILEQHDAQIHPQTTLHHNNQFTIETNEQAFGNGCHQPESDMMACLKGQSCNPDSHSQPYLNSLNLEYYERRPHSQAQSISPSKPQDAAQYNSENESDQNYEISYDNVNNTNIPGCNYTSGRSRSDRGSNFAESSRKHGRGKANNLHGWGSGKKMMLQLNEHNQVIGNLAAPFASQLGVLARDGKKVPLIYTDWRNVPEVYKDRIWQEVKDNTNLQDDCKSTILGKIAKTWRNWKCNVKELYLIPYFNDNEKLAQHPPDDRVEKDQWPELVRYWKSKAALEVCKQNKINRNKSKRFHTSGRTGYANLKDKLKKRGIEGEVVDLSSFKKLKQLPVDCDTGEKVETKEHQIRSEELEPERLDQVHTSSPEMFPSQVLTSKKMKMPEYQTKEFDLAVKARAEELVGNMRGTMAVELAEMCSGMKQTWKSGRCGHMAFSVPSVRTQAPESSSVEPTTSYFEDVQRGTK